MERMERLEDDVFEIAKLHARTNLELARKQKGPQGHATATARTPAMVRQNPAAVSFYRIPLTTRPSRVPVAA
jgi:hypothetical protein